ncbi:metallophosphoesterase family protein [Flavicella marina]|uniref:metallophosphoesterase family protein n=1 Tax=Flavicella marina TaxID=1475951 RepID=UPI0012657A34|nr:metallophosphoesterase family protein [Flavicella marina]
MSLEARTFVIGDIHGALKALVQILERAKVTENDLLIFLGDYVDGWSQSPEVINYLIQLRDSHNCIFMRGNHDDLCYRWLKFGESNDTWLIHGGASSVKAYENVPYNIRNIHIHFFENLNNYYVDEANRLFVHAGFTNHNGVKHEYFDKMFYWDRSLWELALAMDKNLKKDDLFFPKRLSHYKEIFIGHTSLSRIERDVPTNAANVWNVDTGAAHKNPLTIMDVDTKEYWQSDPVFSLYPDEKGRN